MPTLEDVARAAGVSKSTVSRVFNEPGKVKTSTRQKVEAAAKALNYRPSRVARRLRVQSGRAHMLGLVITDIQNPFFADLTRGVEEVARAHDHALILSGSDEDPEKQRLALETFRTERVDGVVLPPVRERAEDIAVLAEVGIPVVCVDRRLPGAPVDTVTSDNRRGARLAVEHLLGLGHRRIGFVGGISRISTTKERRRGYEEALARRGLALDPALVRRGNSRQESGRELTGELLDLEAPPTALFTGNNLMTLGALIAIHERGLSIPEDVALVGYDDVSWALALNPPVTVVAQSSYEMGRRAAELLLGRIAEPERTPSLVTLQPRLVVRKSCGGHLQSGDGTSDGTSTSDGMSKARRGPSSTSKKRERLP